MVDCAGQELNERQFTTTGWDLLFVGGGSVG